MIPIAHLDVNGAEHYIIVRHRVPSVLRWHHKDNLFICVDRALGYGWTMLVIGMIMFILGLVMSILRHWEPRAILTTAGGLFVIGLGFRIYCDSYKCTVSRDSQLVCIVRRTMREQLVETTPIQEARICVRKAALRSSHISTRYKEYWTTSIETERSWFIAATVESQQHAEKIAKDLSHKLNIEAIARNDLLLTGLAVL